MWLEKEHDGLNVATLGILLGNPNCLGKGIGRQAVEMSIQEALQIFQFTAVKLNVRTENHRAIACYRHCGFQVVGEGTKTGTDGREISYITMRRQIGDDEWIYDYATA